DLPSTQSIMPFQNEPDPTVDGIRSDASKRKVVLSACMMSMASLRNGLEALLESAFLLAESTPPSLTRASANSGDAMNSGTLTVDGSALKPATNSPPPSTLSSPSFMPGMMNA